MLFLASLFAGVATASRHLLAHSALVSRIAAGALVSSGSEPSLRTEADIIVAAAIASLGSVLSTAHPLDPSRKGQFAAAAAVPGTRRRENPLCSGDYRLSHSRL